MTEGKIFLDVSKTVQADDDDLDGAADKLVEELKKLGYDAEVNSIEDDVGGAADGDDDDDDGEESSDSDD